MKLAKKIMIVGLLGVSLLAAGCGTDDSEKVLKFGSDIAFAPFEFMDENNNPTGFDIELATAIAEDMGYKAEFETATFDGLVGAIEAGFYDAVISAMTITEERAEKVLFSDPYFISEQYIAVKKGSDVKSLEDIKDKKVGVQLGTTGQIAVEKIGINPNKYEMVTDAMNDLINGGVDVVVADAPVVLWFIKQNPDKEIECIPAETEVEYYGVAFNKNDKELAEAFNASLKKLIDSGEYTKIYKKWFNEDPPEELLNK